LKRSNVENIRLKDNAIVNIETSSLIEEATRKITGQFVTQRIDFWMRQCFRFGQNSYSSRSKYLNHEWYCHQVEVCTNIVFKSATFCTSLFERLISKFSLFGLPDNLSQVFKLKRDRRVKEAKVTRRLYGNDACLKGWLYNNSIKLYNKLGYFLRVETTINRPDTLGLKKPLCFLQSYFWQGYTVNQRFYSCLANVEVNTISNEEESLKHQRPVENDRGQKIAAVDLRKQRQAALIKELLKPKYVAHGFTTRQLSGLLDSYFSNPAQIRYELRKLIARNVVKKKKGKSVYMVTSYGYRWIWASISGFSFFKNPIKQGKNRSLKKSGLTERTEMEEAYCLLEEGLNKLTKAYSIAS